MWWFRQTFSVDEATVRVVGPTRRVRFATATSLGVGEAVVHTGQLGGVRLSVVGPGADGQATRAGVDGTMRRERRAQVVLLDWARRRPDLVADDATRAYLAELEDAAVRRR